MGWVFDEKPGFLNNPVWQTKNISDKNILRMGSNEWLCCFHIFRMNFNFLKQQYSTVQTKETHKKYTFLYNYAVQATDVWSDSDVHKFIFQFLRKPTIFFILFTFFSSTREDLNARNKILQTLETVCLLTFIELFCS